MSAGIGKRMILLKNSISLRWIWNYVLFNAMLFDKVRDGKCADFANILVLIFGPSAYFGRFSLILGVLC